MGCCVLVVYVDLICLISATPLPVPTRSHAAITPHYPFQLSFLTLPTTCLVSDGKSMDIAWLEIDYCTTLCRATGAAAQATSTSAASSSSSSSSKPAEAGRRHTERNFQHITLLNLEGGAAQPSSAQSMSSVKSSGKMMTKTLVPAGPSAGTSAADPVQAHATTDVRLQFYISYVEQCGDLLEQSAMAVPSDPAPSPHGVSDLSLIHI
mgnify:CR=1 FL=1